MPKIHVLPRHVAELIAAGEVVERPASVVKEIMENAIDAGASAVTLEIRRGGITYIRITDNGCGIAREDIKNAFVSHATSKVGSESDLDSISTLGFRGEALASIAAVSKVDILTRTKEDDIGTRYCIEGGQETLLDDAGCPLGTTLVIRDLFYNTPARMKFLKKDVTEANAVAGVVDRIALSHPEVSVRFIREGKETLLTPGNGDLHSAVYSVFGKSFAENLLPVAYELDGIRIDGYTSKPLASRANRSMQYFFLNGRLVKTRTAMAALEEAYKHSIMVGKFPACVLHIHAPYEAVDVNVHPAKTEVRFANEKRIFEAVYYAVQNAIKAKDPRPQMHLDKLKAVEPQEVPEQLQLPKKQEHFWQRLPVNNENTAPIKNQPVSKVEKTTVPNVDKQLHKTVSYEKSSTLTLNSPPTPVYGSEKEPDSISLRGNPQPKPIIIEPKKDEKISRPVKTEEKKEIVTPVETVKDEVVIKESSKEKEVPEYRVIGEAFRTYILVETEKKLLLIDKHAAHERMLYEQLRAHEKQDSSQLLLSPVAVTLSKEEYSVMIENIELMSEAGFEVEDFGSGTVLVRSCPMCFENDDISSIVEELAGYLLNHRQKLVPEKLDWLYHNVACRAAIKGGKYTTNYELHHFVGELLSNDSIRYCPHGRPVMIELSQHELEKQFGRIQ